MAIQTRLQKFSCLSSPRNPVFGKLEMENYGGSVKDRVATNMIDEAEKMGLLKPGGTIVESSSGNLGISLAIVGMQRNYRVIIVVDPNTTQANRRLIAQHGAELVDCTTTDANGNYQRPRIELAYALSRQIPGAFFTNQCFNPANWRAHYIGTGAEILEQTQGKIGVCVVAVGSGGTLGGVSRRLKEFSEHIRIVAVDTVGSRVFQEKEQPYLFPGFGLGWTPQHIDFDLIDQAYVVGADIAVSACERLANREDLLVGPSSGALLAVAQRLVNEQLYEGPIVCVLPDGGGRYVDSIFSHEWLQAKHIRVSWDEEEFHLRCNEIERLDKLKYCPYPGVPPHLKGIVGEMLKIG